jgi:DNA (cytosine-5)-methyltransferase 1
MYFYNQKPIRLIELFAGIGSQAKAMKNLGIDFEHWFVCEFDKYAIQSYNAVHNTNFTTSDVTKITANDLNITDTNHFTYLLTYSFPCQDLSNAGKGRGMEKGSGTRSGLLWEVERLLNECSELPQVLLMENVPQVHSVKNKEHFDKWIAFLESKGYSNYWQDLNAKDYGIPQSRNRCYMVSILGEHSFEFPAPIPLELRLGDLLEQEVDEKYYLSDDAIQGRTNSNFRQYNLERSLINDKDIHPTILARYDGSPTLLKEPTELQKEVCNRAIENDLMTPYDIIDYTYSNARLGEIASGMIKTKNSTDNQIANTLTCNAENFGVCVPQVLGGVGEKKSNGGRQYYQQDRIYDDGCAISVTTAFNPYYATDKQPLRIRKLTPKETWRLMGFADCDVERAAEVCSNTQLYKQAGNSIVVNVLMEIFKALFVPKQTRSQWLDDLLNN